MIIYLYGPDSYRRARKLHELVVEYRGKNKETDIFEADLEKNPDHWTNVRDFLEQPSMFADSKLAILRGANEVPERDEKEWIKTLKKELESVTIFVIAVDQAKPRKAFQFLTKPPTRAQEFPELVGVALSEFIKKECSTYGVVLSPDAFRFFADAIQNGVERGWTVVRALQKTELAHFPAPVSLNHIQTILTGGQKTGVFALARGILNARNSPEALFFLERALHEEEAAYVFNMAGSLAQGPAILKMADYDVAVKSGKLEYEEALTDLALGGERFGLF
ncbi:MAG: hypothetical protein AAB631_02085 [Patescibacteria group bacterium]